MEVEEIQIIGLPMPEPGSVDVHVTGLEWDREKIVVASISEVMPHPNADRLVLCKLFDGQQEHVVLTGAPNLFEYKGIGPLPKPLKVAYAKEGAQIYDGHQEGLVLTTLKRAKIRGVNSYSMVCSEKELGISDEHEGIMLLDDDAPVGTPLADYMGDAVLDVKLLPSYARCASMLGLAREIAAMTGKPLKPPDHGQRHGQWSSAIVGDFAEIEITNPEMNPRFVLGLIKDIELRPSPAWVQRRLKLAGMRPINNIVDATNYAMLETGRAAARLRLRCARSSVRRRANVKIITRTAKPGEKLTTLDNIERTLDATTVLVCDDGRVALDCRGDGRTRRSTIEGRAGSPGVDRAKHRPSCSKARPGTSSTSARPPAPRPCPPKPPTASRAASTLPWPNAAFAAGWNSCKPGPAGRWSPAWWTTIPCRRKTPPSTSPPRT